MENSIYIEIKIKDDTGLFKYVKLDKKFLTSKKEIEFTSRVTKTDYLLSKTTYALFELFKELRQYE